MANKLISNFAASLRICICEAICKINPNQKKGRKKHRLTFHAIVCFVEIKASGKSLKLLFLEIF